MTEAESSIPELYREYRTALKSNNLPKAVGAAVKIEESSDDIQSLLNDFKLAIQNDETELARTLLVQISNAYDERGSDEQARIQRAVAAVEEGSLSESERKSLLELPRKAAATNMARSSFLNDSLDYFENSGSENDIINRTEQTRSSEDDLSVVEETAEATSESASLSSAPALLNSSGPEEVVVGNSVSLTVTVGNVGDEVTQSLSLSLDLDDGLSTDQANVSVGTLAANSQTRVDVNIQGDTTGTHSARIVLQSNDSSVESVSKDITVSESSVSIREAITGDSNGTMGEAEIQQSILYWSNGNEIPGTGGETISTDEIQTFITKWIEQNGGKQ